MRGFFFVMQICLLGYSQSGKRTLFALLTGRAVPAQHSPGDTLEGHALVRDPRVGRLAEIEKPARVTYAGTTFVLCPDVEEGGKRAWLDSARKADMVCLVVRAFGDDGVYHPAGSVDAERDCRNLDAELLLADLEMIETRLSRLAKEARAGLSAGQKLEQTTLTKARECLEGEQPLTCAGLVEHELDAIASLGFLTLKPVLWVYNVDEADLADPSERRHPAGSLLVAAKIEQEISTLDDPAEREAYRDELGLNCSGVDRLTHLAYDTMGLMSFYTTGKDEVRAWTIRKGTLAPAAAGKVHTDMERGFIRVEVIKFDDLIACGSEAEAKKQGKLAVRGKDYAIEDGDICHFLFNV